MERIWLNHYPPGIPADITDEAARYDSLVALFEESCGRHAGRPAFHSMGASLSYAQLDERSRHFAGWLQALGIKKGDRVALMLPNVLQYPICLFGALRAGAVVVNTNPLYTATELTHQLSDSGAATIIIAENFAATLEKALSKTAIKNIVVTSIGEMLGTVKGAITNLVVRHVKKLVPPWKLPGTIDLSQALKVGKKASYEPVALGHGDLACLQYTGGTTGVAKGAMLTHGNLVSNVC